MSSELPVGRDADRRPHGRRFLVLWLLLSVSATVLAWILLGPLMPPGNGSVQASGQVFDNKVLLAVVTPVCVFVLLFVAYVLIAFGRNGSDELLADGPADRGNRRIQIVWIVVTSAIMCGLGVFGSYELLKDGAGGGQGPSPTDVPANHAQALNVQVIAQQWQFTYRYPSYGGIETSTLELPAHTLVEFHVTSLDVVHSFWAYQLVVKADANPGTDNIAYAQLKNPLSFQIRCVELCGLWHGYMYDTGQVVPQAQFIDWIAKEQKTLAPVERYLPAYAPAYLPQPIDRGG